MGGPQVRGAPSGSLPLTHEAQADLWRHQNPEDGCAGNATRFLISYWDMPNFHGIGSHLHLMTGVLGLAVTYGRVFGLLNYTYHRAQHDGCRGKSSALAGWPPGTTGLPLLASGVISPPVPGSPHLLRWFPSWCRPTLWPLSWFPPPSSP